MFYRCHLRISACDMIQRDNSQKTSVLEDVLIFFLAFNALLHFISMLLLGKLFRNQGGSKPQQLFLLNLSVVELMSNLLPVLAEITRYFGAYNETAKVINWTIAASLRYIYISAMFLITGDRLVASTLNIRYQSICTIFRTKIVIVFTWCFFFLIIPSTFLVQYTQGGLIAYSEVFNVADRLLNLVLCITFLVFAITTYAIIFIFYVKSKKRTLSSQQSALEMFKDSKFFIAIVLISSFTILIIIPLITWNIICFTYGSIKPALAYTIFMLCILSDTVDTLLLGPS